MKETMIASENDIVGALKKMRPIKPRLKQKWVTALRSGKFKQGIEFLYGDTGYCCLGVALVVDGAKFKRGGFCNRNEGLALLDKKNLDKFGIEHELQLLLSALNDGNIFSINSIPLRMPKKTFPEIADYIKKYL